MISFDNIGFESDSDLINFLKHSYFANKTRIATLERVLAEQTELIRKYEIDNRQLEHLLKSYKNIIEAQ